MGSEVLWILLIPGAACVLAFAHLIHDLRRARPEPEYAANLETLEDATRSLRAGDDAYTVSRENGRLIVEPKHPTEPTLNG